ncbi:MAG: hypothetical protein ACRDRN_15660 [Sciscionella sp.]
MNGSDPGGTQQHSGLAEELRALLDVLIDRGEPLIDRMAGNPEADGLPQACDWCPLCAALAVLHGDRSELAVRAGEHAAGLLAQLRTAIAEEHPAGHRRHPAEPPGSAGANRDGGTGRVQHIAVRRAEPDSAAVLPPTAPLPPELEPEAPGQQAAEARPVEGTAGERRGKVQRIEVRRPEKGSR